MNEHVIPAEDVTIRRLRTDAHVRKSLCESALNMKPVQRLRMHRRMLVRFIDNPELTVADALAEAWTFVHLLESYDEETSGGAL